MLSANVSTSGSIVSLAEENFCSLWVMKGQGKTYFTHFNSMYIIYLASISLLAGLHGGWGCS